VTYNFSTSKFLTDAPSIEASAAKASAENERPKMKTQQIKGEKSESALEGRAPQVPIQKQQVRRQPSEAGGCELESSNGTTPDIRNPIPSLPYSNTPSLRNQFGFWELIWDAEHAVLHCEPGAAYVAWLLENRPSQPITALELAAKIINATCPCFGNAQVFHPNEAAAIFFWFRKQQELEALVDCEDTLDPVKEEAWRELEAIYAYQRSHPSLDSHDAEAATRMVTAAIENFWRHLACARTLRGEPHSLAHAFAQFVHEHILEPSRKCQPGTWLCLSDPH